jgi:hypothetical protein
MRSIKVFYGKEIPLIVRKIIKKQKENGLKKGKIESQYLPEGFRVGFVGRWSERNNATYLEIVKIDEKKSRLDYYAGKR